MTISQRRAESAAAEAKGAANAKRELAAGDADALRTTADAKSYELSTIATAEGQAELNRAENKSKATLLTAEAEAKSIELKGAASAGALKAQVDAIGSEAYVTTEVANAISKSSIKLVPDTMLGGNGSGGSSVIDSLVQFLAVKQLSNEGKVPAAIAAPEAVAAPAVKPVAAQADTEPAPSEA